VPADTSAPFIEPAWASRLTQQTCRQRQQSPPAAAIGSPVRRMPTESRPVRAGGHQQSSSGHAREVDTKAVFHGRLDGLRECALPDARHDAR